MRLNPFAIAHIFVSAEASTAELHPRLRIRKAELTRAYTLLVALLVRVIIRSESAHKTLGRVTCGLQRLENSGRERVGGGVRNAARTHPTK